MGASQAVDQGRRHWPIRKPHSVQRDCASLAVTSQVGACSSSSRSSCRGARCLLSAFAWRPAWARGGPLQSSLRLGLAGRRHRSRILIPLATRAFPALGEQRGLNPVEQRRRHPHGCRRQQVRQPRAHGSPFDVRQRPCDAARAAEEHATSGSGRGLGGVGLGGRRVPIASGERTLAHRVTLASRTGAVPLPSHSREAPSPMSRRAALESRNCSLTAAAVPGSPAPRRVLERNALPGAPAALDFKGRLLGLVGGSPATEASTRSRLRVSCIASRNSGPEAAASHSLVTTRGGNHALLRSSPSSAKRPTCERAAVAPGAEEPCPLAELAAAAICLSGPQWWPGAPAPDLVGVHDHPCRGFLGPMQSECRAGQRSGARNRGPVRRCSQPRKDLWRPSLRRYTGGGAQTSCARGGHRPPRLTRGGGGGCVASAWCSPLQQPCVR